MAIEKQNFMETKLVIHNKKWFKINKADEIKTLETDLIRLWYKNKNKIRLKIKGLNKKRNKMEK